MPATKTIDGEAFMFVLFCILYVDSFYVIKCSVLLSLLLLWLNKTERLTPSCQLPILKAMHCLLSCNTL
jgi:hypothetical protein